MVSCVTIPVVTAILVTTSVVTPVPVVISVVLAVPVVMSVVMAVPVVISVVLAVPVVMSVVMVEVEIGVVDISVVVVGTPKGRVATPVMSTVIWPIQELYLPCNRND